MSGALNSAGRKALKARAHALDPIVHLGEKGLTEPVILAGDWTATGWPATMEGAVRSGYLAAEALTRAAEKRRRFISPDLPPSGLMRIFS